MGGHRDVRRSKAAYIKNYAEHEHINLDPPLFPRRSRTTSAKLMLTDSFWGKFGQGSNLTQVTTCSKPDTFNILEDDSQLIHRIETMNEEMVEIFHTFQQECDPIQVNVHFQCMFHDMSCPSDTLRGFRPIERSVLYFDTDSVVYVWKRGQSRITTGNYLGDFTSELQEGALPSTIRGCRS